MNTRKELRTAEHEWRTTPPIAHKPQPKERSFFREWGWKYLVVGVVLLICAIISIATEAHAQVNTDLEALLVQQDRGWHATGNGTQIQSSSVDARALPIVAVWMRSPTIGARYGDWLHVKYLFHCEDRASLVYAVLDSGRIRTMESINGTPGIMEHPRPGSPAYLTLQAVCGLYGYQL